LSRVLFFSLLAAVNPTLLTATTILLLLPSPKRLMLGYLAGAMTTGITVGVVIVEWLGGSPGSATEHNAVPAVDIALGALALLGAYVIRSGRVAALRSRREAARGDQPKKTPAWRERLSRGSARTTFVVGLLLSFPGLAYLTALNAIDKLDYSPTGVVLAVVAANIVMLLLLEVPLLAFTVAPQWTPVTIERFRDWLRENGGHVLVVGLTWVGIALIAKGVISLIVT
jgi:hypothetical protein